MVLSARYRLLNPSKEYEGFLLPTLGKFDFCVKASQLQCNHAQNVPLKDEAVNTMVDTILSDNLLLPVNGIENKKELMAFARRQLCSWLKVSYIHIRSSRSLFI